MKTYDYAHIAIHFEEGAISAKVHARRVERGQSKWDDLSLDPHQAIDQYGRRCDEVRERNPDMPAMQAEKIAMCKWAAELEAGR